MDLHKATKDEYQTIGGLYRAAFPRNERPPFFFIRRRALQNRATMLVAQKNGAFIGFAYTIDCKGLVYLLFFAVAEDKRSGGSGSEILRLLKAYYPDKVIFLAREPLDDTAENSQERVRRRNFYMRNGFVDLPLQIREANVIYDVMSVSENLDPSGYDALMEKWAGKFVLRFVKMQMLGN